MSAFIDTSAFIALVEPEDAQHGQAVATWLKLLSSDEQLVTSNYVVVETCALLQRRSGNIVARRFLDENLPVVLVQWVDVRTHQDGITAAVASSRRGPSVVDCTSFLVMRKLGIRDAFAFDPHFTSEGFNVIGG